MPFIFWPIWSFEGAMTAPMSITTFFVSDWDSILVGLIRSFRTIKRLLPLVGRRPLSFFGLVSQVRFRNVRCYRQRGQLVKLVDFMFGQIPWNQDCKGRLTDYLDLAIQMRRIWVGDRGCFRCIDRVIRQTFAKKC